MSAAAFAAMSLAALIIFSSNQAEVSAHVVHVFAPMTLIMGAMGLVRSFMLARRLGMRDAIEGMATLSFLAFTWGLDAARVAGVRALAREGEVSILAPSNEAPRIVCGFLIIIATIFVLRWLTRRTYGEWLWPLLTAAWIGFVLVADPWIQEAVVTLYDAIF